MKLLVCGNRKYSWDNLAFMQNIILSYRPKEIISGGAKGADSMAAFIAEKYGIASIVVRADWDTYGKQAGIIRNEKMLRLKPDIVLAFNNSGKGTQHMIKIANDANIQVVVVDGILNE
jgi:ABC-type Fe3+-hydroxamate transport system substrate-binding protein